MEFEELLMDCNAAIESRPSIKPFTAADLSLVFSQAFQDYILYGTGMYRIEVPLMEARSNGIGPDVDQLNPSLLAKRMRDW